MDKYELFKTLKLSDIGFINTRKSDPLWKYCLENNLITVYDLITDVKKAIVENRTTNLTSTMLGLIKLCLYKYYGVMLDNTYSLMNSKFIINNKPISLAKSDFERFTLLGLSASQCMFLYQYSRIYSLPGNQL